MTGLPVLWLDVEDDARDRLLASLNESTRRGRNDESKLVALLTGLAQQPRGLEGTGFDGDDLDALIAAMGDGQGGGGPGLNGDPDDVPEPPEEAVTALGDFYRLGDHLLLCGNSTKREDVEHLLGGNRPELMVTDPPYGVVFGGDKGKNSISGDLTQAAIPLSFAVAVDFLDDNARLYLFGGGLNWGMYAGLFDVHLRMQVRPIVWAKEHFVLRPNNYHSQFEMVYFGWKGNGGAAAHWYGDRTATDLWEVSRQEEAEKVHPTQKPVEVCAIPIRNSAPPGGLVYEPFGGSGTTLIAAHLLGRCARVMELDPKWCDVICNRFERFTGIKPERVLPDGTTEPVTFTGDQS
jgi:DNA modification methylase